MSSRLTAFFASRTGIVLVGGIIGLLAVLLQQQGNPPNMGVCVACFERDLAGALGLHSAGVVQYLRPEIPAFVLGSLLAALLFREFRPRGGSAAIVRFVLGAFAMIGALTFLGCPWRALFRLGGGDLNAVVGLTGLVTGIAIGVWFMKRGYTLGRPRPGPAALGWILPGLMIGALILVFVEPAFLRASERGPGAMHAPILLSLSAGLLIGAIAQRSRFCTVGSVSNIILARSFHLASGVVALVGVVVVGNLIVGKLDFGFAAQPVSHSNHIWNFVGMILAGLAFAMAGGCPGRQLFLAGEGNADSGVFVLGMIVGAGFAHNFALAAIPDRMVDGALKVGGPGCNGQVAVLLGIAFCLILGFAMRERPEEPE
jgi:YedE family putative selenium metabolism protein